MLLFLEIFPQKSSVDPEGISVSIEDVLIRGLQRKLEILSLFAL